MTPIPTDEPAGWTIQVFFDGDCPLCIREIRMLAALDARAVVALDLDALVADGAARAAEFLQRREQFLRAAVHAAAQGGKV